MGCRNTVQTSPARVHGTLIFKNLEEVKGCRRFNRVGISWVVIASSRHFEPAAGLIARALENDL